MIITYLFSFVKDRPIFLFLLLMSYGDIVTCQEFNNYQPIVAEGEVPEDFWMPFSLSVDTDFENIQQQKKRKPNPIEKEFVVASNYQIRELLLSGKVLFNHELTRYLTKIGDRLLKDHPGLRDSIRFYIVKSPAVNAFTSNNGIVFVNTGLIAQLQSEAQLAFVLCHEIMHFKGKHPFNIFLDKKQNNSKRQTRPDVKINKNTSEMVIKNLYSKEVEAEADSLAIELFVESGYDPDAPAKAFDLLKRAYLPFENIVFDTAFFDSGTYQLPGSYFLDTCTKIGALNLKYNEGKSTHPDPDIRKGNAIRQVDRLLGEDNIVEWPDIGDYAYFQKVCRYESCLLFLKSHRYEEALYATYVMLKSNPNSYYLQKCLAQALYGMSKFMTAGRFWDVHVDYTAIEGPSQQVFYFMEQIQPEELNALAIQWNWRVSRMDTTDIELKMMCQGLVGDLVRFFREIPSINESHGVARIEGNKDSLIEKKALDWISGAIEDSSDLLIKQLYSKDNFKHLVDKAAIEYVHSLFQFEDTQPKKRKIRARRLALNGFNLGLHHVVYVDPYYQKIDERKEQVIQFEQSNVSQLGFIKKLGQYSEKLDLDFEMLSSAMLKPDEVDKFNDIVLLNEWMEEKAAFEDMDLVSVNQSEVSTLIQKYGTPYFVWTSGFSLVSNRESRGIYLLGAPLMFPLYLYLTPRYDTFIYTRIYNLETGKFEVIYPKYVKLRDRQDVLNSVIYDMVLQIKSK